jgi:uncharacterized membrane protein YfcA
MPELFPDFGSFLACALIMGVAQFVYATVGFGAGMFAIALLAMVLPELAGAVTVLLLLTFVTEVWVLAHDWRRARVRLLLGLVPAMAVGLWIGTQVLVSGDVGFLKRLLGLVVAGAGMWFLCEQRRRARVFGLEPDAPLAAPRPESQRPPRPVWLGPLVGVLSGVLGGLFGTGGPPVIILLRAYRVDKGTFRATLLWYFYLMSLIRAGTYYHAGLLDLEICFAALWLLPASLVGIVAGMVVHRRLSETRFLAAVSALLIILGVLLVAGLQR